MPFRNAPSSSPMALAADFALRFWPADMPRPLVVAILDSQDEREGRTTAVVTEPFVYDHLASAAEVAVPGGFVTDFASIPAVARGLFPPFGRHAKAAVLHDWLYQVGEPHMKAFADRVFLDAMAELKVSVWRRYAMFFAVKIGGGGGYRKEHTTWRLGFRDWHTGDAASPPGDRTAFYSAKWPKPPRPGYRP